MSLLDGLAHYYTLDANPASPAADQVGSENLAAVGGVGASQVGEGILGRALELGATGYLSSSDGDWGAFGDAAWTLSLWLYADAWFASGSTITAIASKMSNAGISGEFTLWANSNREANGRIELLVRDADNLANSFVEADTFGDMATRTAEWIHVLCAHDPVENEIKIAVNGGAWDAVEHTGGLATADQAREFILGARDGDATTLGGTKFNGWIDEVGFWTRVLSDAEKAALYGGGTPPALSRFGSLPSSKALFMLGH